MSGAISSEVVAFPAQATKLYGEDGRVLIPALLPTTPALFSQSLAAVTTLTLFFATAGKRTRVSRIIFSVDAGGPYLFVFGSLGNFRPRIAVPYFITLEFGIGGIDCGINQAVTIRNEHATVAGNIELFFQGNLYDA